MKKQNLRYMKWIGKMIILLFIFNFQFSIFNCSAQRVSLDECLEKALESNFSIKIIRNEARMDKNNLNYSTFLPTLEGTAKQTQTRNDTKTENSVGEVNKMSDVKTDNYTAGVALNWRIFDGLEMFTTHEKQKELLAMGELAVQQAVENLILNVSAAYYNVLVQHHKLIAARHSLELSNERYDEARVRYKIGNRSGLEAQQAKIDLNTDSSTYVRQKEALKSAYITLNKLMNTDLQMVNYVQDTILLGPQLALGTLEQKTLEGNTTLLIAKKDQKISALDLKNARAKAKRNKIYGVAKYKVSKKDIKNFQRHYKPQMAQIEDAALSGETPAPEIAKAVEQYKALLDSYAYTKTIPGKNAYARVAAFEKAHEKDMFLIREWLNYGEDDAPAYYKALVKAYKEVHKEGNLRYDTFKY